MTILRTWSNGWFTSDRTSADKQRCFLGCEGMDSLTHYLRCDPLWTLLHSSCGSRVDALNEPFGKRVCLYDYSSANIARCVVAFQVYHAMRNNHHEIIREAHASACFDEVLDTFVRVANHFAAENGFGLMPDVATHARRRH